MGSVLQLSIIMLRIVAFEAPHISRGEGFLPFSTARKSMPMLSTSVHAWYSGQDSSLRLPSNTDTTPILLSVFFSILGRMYVIESLGLVSSAPRPLIFKTVHDEEPSPQFGDCIFSTLGGYWR